MRGKPAVAKTSLASLRSLMREAEKYGMRNPQTNPCHNIKPYKEAKRERFLSDAEYQQLGDMFQAGMFVHYHVSSSNRSGSCLSSFIAAGRFSTLRE